MTRYKKAIVMGETNICSRCAEFLLESGWKIVAIVSDDRDVVSWARDKSIFTVTPAKLSTLRAANFYLFSIINPYVIPSSFFENKKLLLALNYHDSLLPSYGGVNSTTWAIINGEKQHGVTIHQMVASIDEGDVVAQAVVPIEKSETAFSLNLKCSELLLSLFYEVVAKIGSNELVFSKQNLANKTYYGLKNIPENYGIINGIKDVEQLSRIVRGLTFGDSYNNPVATIKIYWHGGFYIVEDFNLNVLGKKNLAFHKNILLFNKVRDIYGHAVDVKINTKDMLIPYLLTEDVKRYLAAIKARERKNLRKILSFFDNYPDAAIRIFDQKPKRQRYDKKISIPSHLCSSETILTLVCFVLARYFHGEFIVSLYLTDDGVPSSMASLVELRNFIHLSQNILSHSFDKLKNHLLQIQASSYHLVKDFGHRYHLNFLTDIAIAVGENVTTDRHRMLFKLTATAVEIQGDSSCQLQIDNIGEIISTLYDGDFRSKVKKQDLRLINILNDEQYQRMVYDWNRTECDYPSGKTISILFEEQVRKKPDNVAVVYENKKLTYGELDAKANQLARYLQTYGVKAGDFVAICLGRNEQMIVAILGVLKVGGAYVPLDYSHPSERISYVLKDTNAQVIITQRHIQSQIEMTIRETQKELPQLIVIDDEETLRYLEQQATGDIAFRGQASDLAYVIYTSGTTGNPRGVMIEHRGVTNLIVNQARMFGLVTKRSLRCLQFASITFDASVSEIFCALGHGHELYIASETQRRHLDELLTLFTMAKIQIATLPPSLLKSLDIPSKYLKTLIVAGETSDAKLLDKYYDSGVRVINAYGPTETTVCATMNLYRKNGANNIGHALGNVKLYVLSPNMLPVAPGSIGELYVAGLGVARGYLHQAKSTDTRFVVNPFQKKDKKLDASYGRLYGTGDLVYFHGDGSLGYVGRNDFQVKIKGYRVELGEVENKLLDYAGIRQALALVGEYLDIRGNGTGDKYIVAYYVADGKLDESKLYDFMVKQLPGYMVPRTFVYLKQLPLSSNGKVDIKALPPAKFEGSHNYEAPSNEREKLICDAFAKIFGLAKVGVRDDFFKLGGNSLAAIRLVSGLQTNFDINITNIFNLRTPKKLAETESISLTKDFIKHKLEKIKLFYENKRQQLDMPSQQMRDKTTTYLRNSICTIEFSQKPISNVLLTGATGFLGCNLLQQLLHTTSYDIYLLIRATSHKEAVARVNDAYQFYFNRKLDVELGTRVFVLTADLEKSNLDLSATAYQNLATKVDSIIHCAALVKLHGEYSKLESANVNATINLLELAKLTKNKDFHYISTCSVLNSKFISDSSYIYTEDDLPDNLEKYDSDAYVKTKLLGEQQVVKYRAHGIKSNIYRAGNLAFMSKDHRVQRDVEDNAFFNWLRYIFEVQCIAEEISTVDLTPTDHAAQAIIKLFDKEQLSNGIYHIFNPYLFNVADVFTDGDALAVNIMSLNDFIDQIVKHLNDNVYRDLVISFILRQGWLDGGDSLGAFSTQILQNRTQFILRQLNFQWEPVSNKIFGGYIKNFIKPSIVGYMDKMLQRKKILEHLERVAEILPTPAYWFDLRQRFLGVNSLVVQGVAATSFEKDFANKTPYDVYPHEMAENIVRHHRLVIKNRATLSAPEMIKNRLGEMKYLNATIAPLRDDNGDVIGTIGISVDVTAETEAESIKQGKAEVEYELERTKLHRKEQEKFKKLVDQVVHDIRSPLASLLMILKLSTQEIPESVRIALQGAALSIESIANNLLNKYREEDFKTVPREKKQVVLLSLELSQILGEKKYQYRDLPINFVHSFYARCNFIAIRVEPMMFRRMMSNLINNAVDALDGKRGTINLKLNVDSKFAKIVLEDNGKGMPAQVINRIMNNVAITFGKKDGNGIGYTQIHDALNNNDGTIRIKSKIERGTQVTLKFPLIDSPHWVAKEINLNGGDVVVILDDDISVHNIWKERFKIYKKNIQLKCFTSSQGTMDFINNYSPKQKIVLLTDFDLLKQQLNGLYVIKKSNIKRSILVTNHYDNAAVYKLARKNKIKILPKLLMNEIVIKFKK